MSPCEWSTREECVDFLVGSVGQLSAGITFRNGSHEVGKAVGEAGRWQWGHGAALGACTQRVRALCSAEQG